MAWKRLVVCFILCCSVCSAEWSFERIIATKGIGDLQLSPDNKALLFTVSEALLGKGKDTYISKIYLAQSDGTTCNPLSESAASQPKWSPDGRWISFLAESAGAQNLFLVDTEGKTQALTQVAKDIQTYRWSPDSKQIAFMMSETLKQEPQISYIFDQEQSINRLWLIDIEHPHPKPLTDDHYFVREAANFWVTTPEYDWSPDGKTIVFSYSPGSGCAHYYRTSSLAAIDVESGTITPWEKKEDHETFPLFSPDGQWVAYLTGPGTLTLGRRIALRSADGKQCTLLAPTDEEGICYYGKTLLDWSPDGKQLLFFEPKGTKFQLMLVPVDGSPGQAMTFGDLLADAPSISPDRTMMAFQGQNLKKPPEAYVSRLDSVNPVQISHINESILQLPIPKTDVIQWTSKDGLKIEGLVTYPLNFQEGKRYPLLVDIHGGPMGFFNECFIGLSDPYPHAVFAEEGFLILRPNPRGSCGYGKAFREANVEDLGGGDYADIMAGVDALIERGIADNDRMGIMGWSYGGYMTAWIVGQNNRFKAASVGAGLTHLGSFAGTTDSQYILKDYFLGGFLEKEQLYKERSPIYYVRDVQTPCLIQHGLLDQRVPPSQAFEYYHALKDLGKEVVLLLYPHMQHAPATPQTSIEVMKANFDWFTSRLTRE